MPYIPVCHVFFPDSSSLAVSLPALARFSKIWHWALAYRRLISYHFIPRYWLLSLANRPTPSDATHADTPVTRSPSS